MAEKYRNIALIATADLNTKGGAQISTRNMLNFDGDWLVVSPYNVKELGIPQIATQRSIPIPSSGQRIPVLKEIGYINRALEERDPQRIILTHPDFYTSSLYLGLTAEMKRRTHALWRGMVDSNTAVFDETIKRKVLRVGYSNVLRRIQTYIGNHVQSNLVVSQAVADSLIGIGINSKKIICIPEQVGNEYNPELRVRHGENLRGEFLHPDELGIAVVSRVSPEKGINWLPEIYERLRQERGHLSPDAPFRRVRLSLVGPADGHKSRYLEKILQDIHTISSNTQNLHAAQSVVFDYKGPMNPQELAHIYNTYDVLLNPSPAEGFGRVTVEAMNGGMTVVGRHEAAATAEILNQSPYSTGILVDSPIQAAEQILGLMQRDDLLKLLQQQALQWSSGHYSLENAEQEFWRAIGLSTQI